VVDSNEQAILAANAAFYAAFVARDGEAMAALWASQTPVTCIHPGWSVLHGRDAVLASWQGILANPEQPRIVAGGAEARILGDMGVVLCRELVAGNPLMATNVFVREDSGWKLVHHQSGPVFRPTE
jgi:ketosteroid isomerase-like protein